MQNREVGASPTRSSPTVTGELEPHVATGPTAWEGGVRALDLGVRRPPASSRSADPREGEGPVPTDHACAHRQGGRDHPRRGWRRVRLWTSDRLLFGGRTLPSR